MLNHREERRISASRLERQLEVGEYPLFSVPYGGLAFHLPVE
jgi:hypothetical protein